MDKKDSSTVYLLEKEVFDAQVRLCKLMPPGHVSYNGWTLTYLENKGVLQGNNSYGSALFLTQKRLDEILAV